MQYICKGRLKQQDKHLPGEIARSNKMKKNKGIQNILLGLCGVLDGEIK